MKTPLLAALAVGLALPLHAQDFGDTSDAVSGIRKELKQSNEKTQDALREIQTEDRAAIKEAGLGDGYLIASGLEDSRDPKGTFQNTHELAVAIQAAYEAVEKLHTRNKSVTCNGTLANMQDSAKSLYQLFSGDKDLYVHGCLSHQAAVFDALKGMTFHRLNVRKIQIGSIIEHHAVVVYRGSDWRQGVVFDGWIKQGCVQAPRDMTFPAIDWESKFKTETAISNARLED